jgi:hypothetical protein
MKIIDQAGFAHRRSRGTCDRSDRRSLPARDPRRDGVDEIDSHNRLADHRGAPATRIRRIMGTIDIRDFDECHECFETFDLLS